MAAQDTIERMWKAIETDQLDDLGEIVADDVVCVNAGVRVEDVESLQQMLRGYVGAFDMEHRVTQVFADPADPASVAVQLHVTGVHTGTMVTPMGEIEATGNRFELDSVDVVRIGDDGRITSWLAFYDPAPMYAALGLAPG